jgi:hypothetical protein
MRAEAANAGFYEFKGNRYPRVQLRTIAELLDGHGIDYPPTAETVFRPTIWPPESIPIVPRARRKRRPKVAAAQATWVTADKEPRAVSVAARLRREGYVRRVAEDAERVEKPKPSPAAPRSLRTSKRDR